MGVEKIFSFTSWDTDHPRDRHPGERIDAQFDAHANAIRVLEARIDALVRADGKLHDNVLPFATPPHLLSGGNVATLSEAAAEDWAEVSMEWAEHMPDTIPGGILATNAITGDHWSSRWWANQAARLAGRGTVTVIKLKRFVFNGSTTTFPLLDDATSAPIVPATNVSQLSIVVDGVPQEPGVDFVLAAAGASVTFTTAPAADARNFATYALQGTTAASSTTVVGATLFATRVVAAAAILPGDVIAIATGGYTTAGDGGGARYYRVGGSTFGGFQSVDGAWWAIEQGDINVRQYGAVGNGTGDDTTAVRLAVQALQVRTNVDGHNMETARLVFPPGVYKLTGSINLQDTGNGATGGGWSVVMSGATILCAAAGKSIFDCLGARWGTFVEGVLVGEDANKPAIGIQYGRRNPVPPGPPGDGMSFLRVKMLGRWTRSGWYNLAGESSSFESCVCYNEHGQGGSAIVIDGCNHLGAITDFAPTTMPADTSMSCAQTTILHGWFGCGPNGDPCIDTYAVEMLTIINTYMVSRGAAVRHTAIGSVGSIVSRLHYDFHAELHTNNVEFVRLGVAGPMVVDGMYVADVTPMASVALIKAGAGVNNLFIYDGEIHAESSPVGSGALFSGTVGYAGSIRGNVVSTSTVGDVSIAFTAAAGSLGLRGALNRVALNAVLTAPRTWTLPPANSVPDCWRFHVDDIVGGIGVINTLTIARAGADTINGQSSFVLNTPFDRAVFVSDGATKWTVESGGRELRFYDASGNIKVKLSSTVLAGDPDWTQRFSTNSLTFSRNGSTENILQLFATAGAVNSLRIDNGTTGVGPALVASGETDVPIRFITRGAGKVTFTNANDYAANGSVATVLGSLGPAGAHTTVQKWLTIRDGNGNSFYIPLF